MTQNEKILAFLAKGNTLTQRQAFSRFGARRLAGRVAELRTEGYPIYNNGGTYRLGRPSREMIAVAYKKLGASAFQ